MSGDFIFRAAVITVAESRAPLAKLSVKDNKMKVHTTNYHNVFIEVAEDCPVTSGQIPPMKGDEKTIANMQFELVSNNPYKFTSDEVFFQVYATRNNLKANELDKAKAEFFSKGQPCFRASPLTKRYGWGVHCDKEGKVALVGYNSPEYHKLLKDDSLKVIKAMRSGK